jgi:hypothetical protein
MEATGCEPGCSVAIHCHVAVSHRSMALSYRAPEASMRPSGEKATAATLELWPSRQATHVRALEGSLLGSKGA